MSTAGAARETGAGVGGPRVALVLVSHAAAAAEGAAEIARQMAPDVLLVPAGGADGRIGTSVETVQAAIERAGREADGPDGGVVVLTDLGSAVMSTEAALEVLEALDEEAAARVRVPQAPFVEGAVAAAVEAQQGADVEAVARAAVAAGRLFVTAAAQEREGGTSSEADVVRQAVVLPPGLGLHARPAALLAREIAAMDVPVQVDGANGASVLELMGLGASGGSRVEVSAAGPGAERAVREVVRLLTEGLEGERPSGEGGPRG